MWVVRISVIAILLSMSERPEILHVAEIPEVELTPLMRGLVRIIDQQQEHIKRLEDEILKLKGGPGKPVIKPSRLEQKAGPGLSEGEGKGEGKGKSGRGPRRSKTVQVEIHESPILKVEGVPAGSRFKGYQRYGVQDLKIAVHNICYRLEQWRTPEGGYLTASVPEEVGGKHFGPTLVSYLLYQYYHQQVTQPLLLEQLWAWGIKISAGQLSQLLSEGHEGFHQEKQAVLAAGIEGSSYLQSDDTGARHQGRNGYCTVIGNELFSWFESTESKSRVNFLSLLQSEHKDYVVNAEALAYMEQHRLPRCHRWVLEAHGGEFATAKDWQGHLHGLGIGGQRQVAIATEGALVGSLLAHGFPAEMAIVSDDAGQFKVFQHALCWIHAERGINRILPLTDLERQAQDWVREQIWHLYADLKSYQEAPSEAEKVRLGADFDALCQTETVCEPLNQALQRLHQHKAELLLVLDRPEVPLHNNLSERDIREYVKKRKISGSTRSASGRRCRDTFASLKKTCRKLRISFWEYLQDRVTGRNATPSLADTIRQAAQANA